MPSLFTASLRARHATLLFPGLAALVSALTGCSGQIPGLFQFIPVTETFSTNEQINTKLDMLWVVDNSASMDVSQDTLRKGFAAFAAKYMSPKWDIRVAVITSDTYLAHPGFAGPLGSAYEQAGYQSSYLAGQSSSPWGTGPAIAGATYAFQDPSYASWVPGTITPGGLFHDPLSSYELNPRWGTNWALLLAGNHDGPMAALCYEDNPYFFFGESQCAVRDSGANRGPEHCIRPQGSETGTTQCVNTLSNDTIHSGMPIISTLPPAGTPGDAAWVSTLIDNFTVNLSTGSSGSGSERGMSSVLQLLKDNESPATRLGAANPFFRPGSLRIIAFLSDEDDQTISLEANDPTDPAPVSLAAGPFGGYISSASNCPVVAGSPQTANCCAAKTVALTNPDGTSAGEYSYIIPTCPAGYPTATTATSPPPATGAILMPVNHIKAKYDAFFQGLDGSSLVDAQSSYFVAAIVLKDGNSIKTVRESKRCPEQVKIYGTCNPDIDASSDRGDRYLELVDDVGNGSLSMDLLSSDYTPILDSIGQSVLSKKATFTLGRAPTGAEQMIVTIAHADGTTTTVPAADYTLTGKVLAFTSTTLILGLGAADSIHVAYQPNSAN